MGRFFSFKWLAFPIIAFMLSLTLKQSAKTKTLAFEGKTYLPAFELKDDVWAKGILNQLTLEEKIAQFFMVASWPNRNESHQQEIEQLVRNQKIGGIIYFQGDRQSLARSVKRMQAAAKTPLLIGMDAEWGTAMRLNGEDRFPYAYTLGAANDTALTRQVAEAMAQECIEMGIHLNFAPVADVHSNRDNPVIGFRSFGENQDRVAEHVIQMVKGMEQNGIMTSVKHFPGHGDTDTDSHLELPVIRHDLSTLSQREWIPFRAGINAGASTVMIGHLNVPALDKSGTPASLSSKIIRGYLRDSLGFKGLVISDALNMKAVSERYGKAEVVLKAFEAGNDILLFPENVSDAIGLIADKVRKGGISETEINERCLRLLKAKYFALNRPKHKSFTSGECNWIRRQVYEKALVLAKQDGVFPLVNTRQKVAWVRIGIHTGATRDMVNRFQAIDQYHFYTFEEAAARMQGKLEKYDVVITSIHPKSVLASGNFSMPGNYKTWLACIPEYVKKGIVHFGNPSGLNLLGVSNNNLGVIFAWENHPLAQESAVQAAFGAIGINGKLPSSLTAELPPGYGHEFEAVKRLKYSQPEEVGIDPEKLSRIDEIVNQGIKAGAFPGCQVLLALDGKIIYQKSFGTVTYEDTTPVNNNHVYDIASISKIVGSTAALMRLQSMDLFSLEKQVKDYLPELTSSSPVGNIHLRKMMAHQAGFTPWIAFYKETVKNGSPDQHIYAAQSKTGFEIPVAQNMWIRNDYETVIYDKILRTPLTRNPKYEYSDLGYYFVKKIVEKQSGERHDLFLYKELYDPMGLRSIRYLPQLYFPLKQIVPTEHDKDFRGQLIHGFVHDPGAAMLGGVGGHAGIFSNSTDLAAMMQLFLNKGNYAGMQLIREDVIAEYTKAQFSGNRRGAGFDKPTKKKSDGPTCPLVSLESFGHSGFTGTFTWADPSYGINYVFLSNRVNPDATNRKIVEMGIRTKIQQVIYEAVIKAKGKKGT